MSAGGDDDAGQVGEADGADLAGIAFELILCSVYLLKVESQIGPLRYQRVTCKDCDFFEYFLYLGLNS